MGHIKKIRIIGFKKFSDFSIEFNEKTNILVGDNEAGKSTVIEAIDILINKTYENYDKYILADLFNRSNISKFIENPHFENLPKIVISGEFSLDSSDKNAKDYYGINWHETDKKTFKYGIVFECSIDKELKADVANIIKDQIIPFEFYSLKWTTFKNETYNKMKKAITFVPIDASSNSTFNSIDFYSRRLFIDKNLERMTKIKTEFRSQMDKGFESLKLEYLDNDKKFGLNHKKLILENIIGILDEDILIENRGKGIEKIIKTEIAIDNKRSNDVIAIEEPENNLSHTSLRKIIHSIESKCKEQQLIITTHNSLIASGLLLNNVVWISNNGNNSLSELNKATSKYFLKLENENLLRFIIANKVVLVEGPSEKLILPYLFKKSYENEISFESESIDIISCNGLAYKRYLEIAKVLNKKVAVLTDNDGSQEKIKEIVDFNKSESNIRIFVPDNTRHYTWEVILKEENEKIFNENIKIDKSAKYLVNGKELEDKKLAYMLLNKVEISLKVIEEEIHIIAPEYVKGLFKWIRD